MDMCQGASFVYLSCVGCSSIEFFFFFFCTTVSTIFSSLPNPLSLQFQDGMNSKAVSVSFASVVGAVAFRKWHK